MWRREPIEDIAKELIRRRKEKEQHGTVTQGQSSSAWNGPDGNDFLPDVGNATAFPSNAALSEVSAASTIVGYFDLATNGYLTNQQQSDLDISVGVSSEIPSATTGIDNFDFATNEYLSDQPATDLNFSSPEDIKPLASLEKEHRMSFAKGFSQLAYESAETSPRSHFFETSPYSPVLKKSDKATVAVPQYITQSPVAGPKTRPQNAFAPTDNMTGEPWEQRGLMVMPFETTREFIETFFEKQYTPFPRIRQDLFLGDFMAGRKGYCSSALVRILCCLGCRIKGGYDSTQSHHAGIGDRLFEEALQLINSPDGSECNIPNSQALSLMGLHQLGMGRHEQAQEFADESVRRLDFMHRQPDSDRKIGLLKSVQATTLYGAISLAR